MPKEASESEGSQDSSRAEAGSNTSVEKMDVDTPMVQTTEAAEEKAVKAANDDRFASREGLPCCLIDLAYSRCYIITFDSLGGSHTAVYNTLKKYLQSEARAKRGLSDDQIFTDKENCKGTAAKVPEQPNGCDCGLYVMHFAEVFFKKAAEVMSVVDKVSLLASLYSDAATEKLCRTGEQDLRLLSR